MFAPLHTKKIQLHIYSGKLLEKTERSVCYGLNRASKPWLVSFKSVVKGITPTLCWPRAT